MTGLGGKAVEIHRNVGFRWLPGPVREQARNIFKRGDAIDAALSPAEQVDVGSFFQEMGEGAQGIAVAIMAAPEKFQRIMDHATEQDLDDLEFFWREALTDYQRQTIKSVLGWR